VAQAGERPGLPAEGPAPDLAAEAPGRLRAAHLRRGEGRHKEALPYYEALASGEKIESAKADKIEKKGFFVEKPLAWSALLKKYYVLAVRPEWKIVGQETRAAEEGVVLQRLNDILFDVSFHSVTVLTAGGTRFVQHGTGDNCVWRVMSAKFRVFASIEHDFATIFSSGSTSPAVFRSDDLRHPFPHDFFQVDSLPAPELLRRFRRLFQ
jgi:hypothetical protein